jgi:hypothetical protein
MPIMEATRLITMVMHPRLTTVRIRHGSLLSR